jgi:hypothetical protein
MSVLVALRRVSLIPARAGSHVIGAGVELERVARRSLADAGGRAAVASLDAVLASPYVAEAVDHVVDRLLAQGVAEQAAQRIVNGPELEHIVEFALESPGAERLVTRVIESHLVEEAVTQLIDETAPRLPQSQAVWTLIDEVAQSPAVTDAISQQGKGMANQFADEVRQRADKADDRLERAVVRLLRRRPSADGPPDAAAPGAAT